MDFDADPRWLLCKAAVLEVVCVMTEVFALSELTKMVSPSDLVLVCWGYFEVGGFHSESVVALVVRVNL